MRPGRRRLLIVLAAILALNGAVYLAYTLPKSMQRTNLGSRLVVAREETERERQRLAGLKAHFDLITDNTRDTAEFYARRIAPRGASLVPVLREIETLAQSHGLNVGSQAFDYQPIKDVPLDRFVVKMPVVGTYRALVAFVGDLERSSHFVTLDQITVRSQQGGQAQMQMVLSCYFRSSPGKQG